MAKLSVGHVTVVPDDLAHMLRWHIFFLCIHEAKLPLFRVTLGLQLLPFSRCRLKQDAKHCQKS